jgi:hypothetical protein
MVNYWELALYAVQEAHQLLLRESSEHQLPFLLVMVSRMPWAMQLMLAMGERERVGDAVDSGDGGGVGAGDAVAMA